MIFLSLFFQNDCTKKKPGLRPTVWRQKFFLYDNSRHRLLFAFKHNNTPVILVILQRGRKFLPYTTTTSATFPITTPHLPIPSVPYLSKLQECCCPFASWENKPLWQCPSQPHPQFQRTSTGTTDGWTWWVCQGFWFSVSYYHAWDYVFEDWIFNDKVSNYCFYSFFP